MEADVICQCVGRKCAGCPAGNFMFLFRIDLDSWSLNMLRGDKSEWALFSGVRESLVGLDKKNIFSPGIFFCSFENGGSL